MPADDGAFFVEMGKMVNNKLHSDMKFEIDGKTVYAHKVILATRSPFFSQMFGSSKSKSVSYSSFNGRNKDKSALWCNDKLINDTTTYVTILSRCIEQDFINTSLNDREIFNAKYCFISNYLAIWDAFCCHIYCKSSEDM